MAKPSNHPISLNTSARARMHTGKTSICQTWRDKASITNDLTVTVDVEVDFFEKTTQIPETDGQQMKLQIWDTDGWFFKLWLSQIQENENGKLELMFSVFGKCVSLFGDHFDEITETHKSFDWVWLFFRLINRLINFYLTVQQYDGDVIVGDVAQKRHKDIASD